MKSVVTHKENKIISVVGNTVIIQEPNQITLKVGGILNENHS